MGSFDLHQLFHAKGYVKESEMYPIQKLFV